MFEIFRQIRKNVHKSEWREKSNGAYIIPSKPNLTVVNYTRNYTLFLDFEKEERKEKEEKERKKGLSRIGRNFISKRNRMGKILTVPAPPSTRSCP